MNREILFRAKTLLIGTWIEGYYFWDEKENKHYIIGASVDYDFQKYEINVKTLGQYSGINDNNGNEIFEGDIVESRASENPEDWMEWYVMHKDGSFIFEREKKWKGKKYKHNVNLLCEDEVYGYGLVVVGNIFD